MADTARRYIEVTADASKAIRELKKLGDSSTRIEKQLGQANSILSSFGNTLKFLGVGLVTNNLVRFADTALDLNQKLKVVVGSAEGAAQQFDDLLDIANRNGIAINNLASSYVRLQTALPTVGIENLNTTLSTLSGVLSKTGAGVQQTNAVMLQFAQGMGAGAVQGEELRAIAENAPVYLLAWREALGETDKSFKELSASASFTAKSAIVLNDEIQTITQRMLGAEDPVLTVARAWTQLGNNFTKFIGDAQKEVPIFTLLAKGILLIADNLDILTKALIVGASAWVAYRSALIVGAVWAGVAAGMTTAAAGATTLTAAMKGLLVFLGPAGLIALGIGAAVTAIMVYWEEIRFMIDNWDATWELIVAHTVHFGNKVLLAVYTLVGSMRKALGGFFESAAGGLGDFATSLSGTFIPGLNLAAAAFQKASEGARSLGVEWTKTTSTMESLGTALASSGQRVIDAQVAFENLEVSAGSTGGEIKKIDEDLTKIGGGSGGGGGGGGSAGKAASAVDKLAKSMQKAEIALRKGRKELGDYLDGLREEIYLVGLTEDERELREVQLKLEAEALDYVEKAQQAVIKGNLLLAESYNKLAEERRAAVPEAQELTEQRQIAEDMQDVWDDALDGIGSTFEDAFKGLFTDGLDSAEDFIKNLGDALLSGIANISYQMLRTGITVPISAQATGGPAGADVAGSGGFGSIFSGTNIGEGISSAITGGFKFIGTEMPGWLQTGIEGVAGTSNLAFGVGALGGGLLGSALFGDKGFGGIGSSIGSSVGTVLGAALTPVLGPFGPIIGGLLGGAGGGFLGSLFGGGNEPFGQFSASGGVLSGVDGRKLGQEALNELQTYIDGVNSALDNFGEILGEEAQDARANYQAISDKLDPEEIEGWLEGQSLAIMREMISAVPGSLGDLLQELATKTGSSMESLAGSFEELTSLLTAAGAALNVLKPDSVETLEDVAEILHRVALEDIPEVAASFVTLADLMQGLKTEAELEAEALDRVQETFAELGIAMPTTVEALRQIIGGLNLTTVAGQEAAAAIAGVAGDLDLLLQPGAEEDAGLSDREKFLKDLRSEENEANDALREMTGLFADWGLELPPTSEALYDLIQAGAYTEDQINLLVASADKLGLAFDALENLTDAATEALEAASEARIEMYQEESDAAIKLIEAQQDARIKGLETERDALTDRISEVGDSIAGLDSIVDSVRKTVFDLDSQAAYGLDENRQRLLGLARSTVSSGVIGDDTSDIVSGLAKVEANDFKTREDYLAAVEENQKALDAIGALAGQQLSEGERQIELLENQIEQIENQIDAIGDQTEALIAAERDALADRIAAEKQLLEEQTQTLHSVLAQQTQRIDLGNLSAAEWDAYQSNLLANIAAFLDPTGEFTAPAAPASGAAITTPVTPVTVGDYGSTYTRDRSAATSSVSVVADDADVRTAIKVTARALESMTRTITRWDGGGMPPDRMDYQKETAEAAVTP